MSIHPPHIRCRRERRRATIQDGSECADTLQDSSRKPRNTPSTPRTGSNYLPGRSAGIFTSDFCESKCTLSPRICNGNRFVPPENLTETA